MKYVSPLRDLVQKIEEVARAHDAWSQAHEAVYFLSDYLTAKARIEEFNQESYSSRKKDDLDSTKGE